MPVAHRARNWDEAGNRANAARAIGEKEAFDLGDFHEGRFADHRENQPGADWDGVFVATTK